MTELTENEQITQRREKLQLLRDGGQPFPNDFRRANLAGDIHKEHDQSNAEVLDAIPVSVSIAGRMMTRRVMGKASFVHLQDMSGKIQLYVRRDDIPEGVYADFKQWDIGDILGAEGVLFRTKTGELSIKVNQLRLLTKSLRPLPEKYHGLTDTEIRYRQRYLDLIMSEETRNTFRVRSQVITTIREFLTANDFLEVETPMMQTVPGGAAAKPFVTHHNALDMELYLRIAPELYLKRLVVGGFERVFEINRNFRNEGLSTRHNPEFTMLEFYQAYADYHELMDLTEEMFRLIVEKVHGSSKFISSEREYDFKQPFARVTMKDSIGLYNPELKDKDLSDITVLREILSSKKVHFKESDGIGKLQCELFEGLVEGKLEDPTFITAYPTEVSPLARRNDEDPTVTDRFELFIGGREIANGFSELNDSEDQAQRFKEQVEAKDAGDDEAMHYDEDYICALEYGLPPTAGEGIGIDRLVMLLTDSPSIRDVLLFPHMRKKL